MAQNLYQPTGPQQPPPMINTPAQSQHSQFTPQQGPLSHNSTPTDRYRPADTQQTPQQLPQQPRQQAHPPPFDRQDQRQNEQPSSGPSSSDPRFSNPPAANGAIYDHSQNVFVSADYRDRHQSPSRRAKMEQEKEDEDNRTRKMEYTDPYRDGVTYTERVPWEDIHHRHDDSQNRSDVKRQEPAGEAKSKTHRVASKVKAVTGSAAAADSVELAFEGVGRAGQTL